MEEVFIMRPQAMLVVDSYKRLLSLPRGTDNPGMSLQAEPGQGKSTLGFWMASQSRVPGSDWPGVVLYIDLVSNAANLDVIKLILMQIGRQYCGRPLNTGYRDFALGLSLIRENNIRGVFIDEVTLLAAGLNKRRCALEFGAIKGFSGAEWALNVMLSGAPDPLNEIFRDDSSLSSRFNSRVGVLPNFKQGKRFRSFVLGFMEFMPLRQSSIIDTAFCSKLLKLSEKAIVGSAGRMRYSPLRTVVDILQEASRLAIESGDEYISTSSLEKAFTVMRNSVDNKAYRDKYTKIPD
jgi:hypothetical protein